MASDTKDIKAVIFDMDGVILDSESISKKSWFMAGKDFDLPEEEILLAFEKSTGCNRLDTQLFFTRMFGEKIDYNIFHEKCSFYFDEIAAKNGIPLMKNAAEILQYLKPKYRIALASSTTADRVVPQLTAENVIDFFEVLVTGDMVKHSKPNPEIYLKACAELGINPENCAAVEDSPNGITSAFSAGLNCIMVPDQIPADKQIKKTLWKECKDLGQLKSFL